MNLGYLLLGLVFLFNPNINVIDVLPDVIGCLFILKGLSKLSDLNRHIASAKQTSEATMLWMLTSPCLLRCDQRRRLGRKNRFSLMADRG